MNWLTLALFCAGAKVGGARELFGAKISRAPYGGTKARSVMRAATPSVSKASNATRWAPPAWAQRWSMITPRRWYSGVAIYNDSNTFVCSAGDWYSPPYPFGVTTATIAAPLSNVTTPTVPGSIWPLGGTRTAATFVGMNFTTYTPVVAEYDRTGHMRWADPLPGVSGSSFYARGRLGASATLTVGDGSIVAYGVTTMARYDPTGPKHAEVTVVQTPESPAGPRVVLVDAFGNGTGMESVLLSADGGTLVAVAARTSADAPGMIVGSEVRVYDLARGDGTGARSAFETAWVSAACLSEDGGTLVLTTADSPHQPSTIQALRLWHGTHRWLLNTTYPRITGAPGFTHTYGARCGVSNAGSLFVTLPLFWGVTTLNQSAVAYWRNVSAPTTTTGGGAAELEPTTLWLSTPVPPGLQDGPGGGSVYLEGEIDAKDGGVGVSEKTGLFVFTTWGGQADPTTGAVPPTLHLFSEQDPSAPMLQIATRSAIDANSSGSLSAVDMARDAATGRLRILAAGLNYHQNVGSSAGVLYAWDIDA